MPRFFALLLICAFLPSCASSDGAHRGSAAIPVTPGATPAVGSVLEAANRAIQIPGALAEKAATGLLQAGGEVLGAVDEATRPGPAYFSSVRYEKPMDADERVAARRHQMGLPARSETRIEQRRAERRAQMRNGRAR